MTPRRRKPSDEPPAEGAFAYEGLDRVLHEKARLGILTALVTQPDGIAFVDLKRACALTDGNLARHLQTLQESGLVAVDKTTGDGERSRPTTHVRLTAGGRRQFVAYLGELERVIDAARRAGVRASTGLGPAQA